MKPFVSLVIFLILGITAYSQQKTNPTPTRSSTVKVYLVLLDDNGKSGRKIGCGDSLIAVTRSITPTATPLRASIEELLRMPERMDRRGKTLENFWKAADQELRVRSATIKNGVAVIRISGEISVAGMCDEPRIVEQIFATARQFKGVRSVRVTINGVPLATAIA